MFTINFNTPNSIEIAKRASADVRFHEISGDAFCGNITYRDLTSAIIRMQRDTLYAKNVQEKAAACAKCISLLDTFIDAQKKINGALMNKIAICSIDLEWAADYVHGCGSDKQKKSIASTYKKILDLALAKHESPCNIKEIMCVYKNIK